MRKILGKVKEIFKKIVEWIFQTFLLDSALDKNQNSKSKTDNLISLSYFPKKLITEYEYYFYNILKELEEEMRIRIHPQLNLASIVNPKSDRKYHNELFRNIDFAVFTEDYRDILLLIEINDNTHNYKNRKIRDEKVRKICEEVGYRLITFYSSYSNEKEYIKNRIIKELAIFSDQTKNQSLNNKID